MDVFKDLVEKLTSLCGNEPDTPVSDNIQSQICSNGSEKLNENETDSLKDYKNAVSTDIKSLCSTKVESENESVVLISDIITNNSHLNHEQNVEEKDNARAEKSRAFSVPDFNEFFKEIDNESEAETVGSIITDIQNNLLSECSTNNVEREEMIRKLAFKAREKVLVTFICLQDLRETLLLQEIKLADLQKGMLLSIINALNDIPGVPLPEDGNQIIDETFHSFPQHKKVYARCKSVFEAFLQNIEKKLKIKNVPRAILVKQKVFFSMAEFMLSKKYLLESSINASEEFESEIKECLEESTLNYFMGIYFLIVAITKLSFACTELSSLGRMLAKLFDCVELCV